MSNATPLRSGQVNGAGDVDALFLKVFGGMVMTAFDEACVMQDKHMIRNISSGKSAQFPATWKVGASYHTPGAEIVGQTGKHNERVIVIDDMLISDVFLADIDEAKAHFEVRSEYARQSGLALANQYDKNVLQVGILAARSSALITGGNGGTVLTSSGTLYKTSASDLAGGVFAAQQAFDEKDVPQSEKSYAIVKPAQYYLLAQSTALINKDWGGMGSYAEGTIVKIGGAQLVMSNHLPSTNVTTGPSAYQGDFTKTAALVIKRPAVGTVKLLDLSTRGDYDPRRLGHLIVSKYAVGHGILRGECAAELKTTT
jgi:hypothetical protein